MKITIAQLNTITGDLDVNYKRIEDLRRKHNFLLVHPLSLTGPDTGSLKHNKDFKKKVSEYLKSIEESNRRISLPVYFLKKPWYKGQKQLYTNPGIYLNPVGGYDEKVYSGSSCIINASGKKVFSLAPFTEDISTIDLDDNLNIKAQQTYLYKELSPEENIFSALTLSLHDYVKKSGFSKVILGLSGGMDSALVAVIAAEALGSKNVHCVLLPSVYTSEKSNSLATDLCRNFGISYDVIPVSDTFSVISGAIKKSLNSNRTDATFENLQARIRGVMLMSISNRNDEMLLSTGNKSEILVGYTTLYGDSCGGFNPIKDLYKTEIYKLAKWYNRVHDKKIPEGIITRPPSAELRSDQKDSDSLPPYDILDKILYMYAEKHLSVEEILNKGIDAALLKKVISLYKNSEYKRRQLTLGPVIAKNSVYHSHLPTVNHFTPSI